MAKKKKKVKTEKDKDGNIVPKEESKDKKKGRVSGLKKPEAGSIRMESGKKSLMASFANNRKSRASTVVYTTTISKQQNVRYAPSYRLQSERPLNREQVEQVIKNVVSKAMDNFSYTPKHAMTLCKNLSEEIKTRIKLQNYDRYKYICVTTIGDRFLQGFSSSMTFLWDPEKDGYISYVYDRPHYYCVTTVYYLYYY